MHSNHWGVPERNWFLEPIGSSRIVILGDALVMGVGVESEQRLGALLETFIKERAGNTADVEVLHIGLADWNTRAACTFARRVLLHLTPALVIHIPVEPDLGDIRGARGYGSLADFSPQARERATGMLSVTSAVGGGSETVANYLASDLCWESRQRYALAARDVERLAQGVRVTGAEYLMLLGWTGKQALGVEHFGPVLEPEQLALLPDAFVLDQSTLEPGGHRRWSEEAHEELALLLYGLIQQRNLLPALQLPPWDQADAAVEATRGSRSTGDTGSARDAAPIPAPALVPEIDFAELTSTEARQVYGGVFGEYAAPYVSLVLRGAGATELRIRGNRMGRPELRGGTTRVFVEEFEVGQWDLVGPRPIDETFALPTQLHGRAFLNVRFVSDDYLYPEPRMCASFMLTSVAAR